MTDGYTPTKAPETKTPCLERCLELHGHKPKLRQLSLLCFLQAREGACVHVLHVSSKDVPRHADCSLPSVLGHLQALARYIPLGGEVNLWCFFAFWKRFATAKLHLEGGTTLLPCHNGLCAFHVPHTSADVLQLYTGYAGPGTRFRFQPLRQPQNVDMLALGSLPPIIAIS